MQHHCLAELSFLVKKNPLQKWHNTWYCLLSDVNAYYKYLVLTNIVQHEIKSLFCLFQTIGAPFAVYSFNKVDVTTPASYAQNDRVLSNCSCWQTGNFILKRI
jgi:hypothetical protein